MSREIEDLALIRKALDSLGEHFDTVHIFTTRHEEAEEGGTVNVNMGTGNWFARYGQINYWLANENADNRKNEERD